eukprot:TRINITY_DN2198_c0_g1_i1.p1 TRINITY_DN2198_c0_g1~~TRINITY_DN2198_c0_g1_i1.p1  ORF type:complete len:527 (+),score=88.25 TRINITY_DN2198_c0_g1_i1:51-1631(+)
MEASQNTTKPQTNKKRKSVSSDGQEKKSAGRRYQDNNASQNKIKHQRAAVLKKRRKRQEDKVLEDFLFGSDEAENFGQELDLAKTEENPLFEISTSTETEETEEKKPTKERQAAWDDPDDSAIQIDLTQTSRLRKFRNDDAQTVTTGKAYQASLRYQAQMLSQASDWAKLSEESEKVSAADLNVEDLILRSSTKLTTTSSSRLPQDRLSVTRMQDANVNERSQAVVQSVQFHPNGQLMLTAGFDKTLRLFHVDGLRNPKIQSVFFPDTPIHNAQFTADGREIIVSGQRKFFYTYDVIAGQILKVPGIKGRTEKSLQSFVVSPSNDYITFLGEDGYLVLVSQASKQWVANLKMNGTVRAAAFNSDSTQLYSTGGDGEVYVWDMRTLRCMHRFVDDGCVHGSAISVSPDNSYLATGSQTGVVNLYSVDTALNESNPKPLKSILNLTTSTTRVLFNHDSQILATCSRSKKDSLKMVHLPSGSVFSNWPTSGTPLHYVNAFDFSPNSGLFAIGNDRGKVLLYRLNHYESS